MLQLTCRIYELGKWIALQPSSYTRLRQQVDCGGAGAEAEGCLSVEPALVQILIGVANRLS